jgi:hypothetical protein
LILLNPKTGEVITKEGRNVVSSDPNGAQFPWPDAAKTPPSSGGGVMAVAQQFIILAAIVYAFNKLISWVFALFK